MPDHERYMYRCLQLAALGAGRVSPNPMVGAVIVHQDKIIGEGYHQQAGGPHAEVNAIQDVLANYPANGGSLLQQATLYVSLEPCAHFGKTPPCSDLIIHHRIPEVIIGARDPFPEVDGKGIEKLRAAGVLVLTGVLEEECKAHNKRFFTSVIKKRPYIILKWAQTNDGYFAPAGGSQQWISSTRSKLRVHQWRAEEDAVLVGKNTALADDPELTVRAVTGRNPVRIVIDRRLELPSSLHVFDGTVPTLIFNEVKTEVKGTTTFISLEDFEHYLPQLILFQLYLLDFRSLIIEGGAATLRLFIAAGLWDEARVFTGPQVWGKGIKAPELSGPPTVKSRSGEDSLSVFHHLATV